jgi:hypothetical protein
MQSYTRAQIKGAARGRAQHNSPGRWGYDDPFGVDQLVEEICDELTRVVNQCHTTLTSDIVSGTRYYCAADLYYLESAEIFRDATSSDKKPLSIVDSEEMTLLDATWRTENPERSGEPHTLVTMGGGAYALYPTPDYSRTAGLIMRGFGLYDRSLWPLDSDACPLPVRVQNTLINGIAYRMAENGATPVDLLRSKSLYQRYWGDKGRWEAEASTYHEQRRSRRSGIDTDGLRSPLGPLNQ